MVEEDAIKILDQIFLVLEKHGHIQVYSESLNQEVYLVLKEADKQLVIENDLPIYTASELHQIAGKTTTN